MRNNKGRIIISFILGGLLHLSALAENTGGEKDLKIVFIRHGEKPENGDNLNCMGLNRSLALPRVLYAKFGVPDYTYIPSLLLGQSTARGRMFQTVTPFAARYNLSLNSSLDVDDPKRAAAELLSKKGTVLLVWERKAIPRIVKALGIKAPGLNWPEDDFDSIWIITFHQGVPTLTRDKENLHPSVNCPG